MDIPTLCLPLHAHFPTKKKPKPYQQKVPYRHLHSGDREKRVVRYAMISSCSVAFHYFCSRSISGYILNTASWSWVGYHCNIFSFWVKDQFFYTCIIQVGWYKTILYYGKSINPQSYLLFWHVLKSALLDISYGLSRFYIEILRYCSRTLSCEITYLKLNFCILIIF